MLEDPKTTFIGPEVEIAPTATIQGHCRLTGRTKVAAGAIVKWGTVAEDAEIGEGASVGPYAHLRPGSVVGANCKIGNFVELKNSKIGARTAIAHLSYVGDAVVGANVNIGCGFITCNFDGRVIDGQRKHKTVIEDNVFMGSDCQAVAPIRIGHGAYVASGSTLTEDVPAGAMAIARSRQVNKPGYAERLQKLSEASSNSKDAGV